MEKEKEEVIAAIAEREREREEEEEEEYSEGEMRHHFMCIALLGCWKVRGFCELQQEQAYPRSLIMENFLHFFPRRQWYNDTSKCVLFFSFKNPPTKTFYYFLVSLYMCL